MKPAAFGLIALGFLLLVLSGLWTSMFPGTSSWTPEKAEQWSKIKDRLHNLGFIVGSPSAQVSMHSGPDTGQAKAEYDRLRIESNAYAAEFTSIHDRPYTIATILKWTGISTAAIGVIALYVGNQSR